MMIPHRHTGVVAERINGWIEAFVIYSAAVLNVTRTAIARAQVFSALWLRLSIVLLVIPVLVLTLALRFTHSEQACDCVQTNAPLVHVQHRCAVAQHGVEPA
ncbi:MAG: hypothetical protein JO187_05100, partial [Acidobacteria bacterium]|nr:hypothetical protein [Acidobacteriota bacterium]